jgi:hypothetical protein
MYNKWPGWGIFQGLGVGLSISRLLVEGCGFPLLSWPWLATCVLGVALGEGLAWLFRRWNFDTRSLWALWPGAAWPGASALLYGLFPAVGILLAVTNTRRPARGPWLEVLVFLGFLGLYVVTLSPTVVPADGGEFQLASAVLGIAHPPGYPLYTMLGWLFAQVPVGDVAYRLNLYGAVCGVLTLVVMARIVRRVCGSATLAFIAAGALGLSTTFWAQSTTANIRSITALFTALCVDFLVRWSASRSTRHLAAFGLCFGLGIGHHSSLVLLGLPFLAYILVTEPRLILSPRRWAPALVALAASLVVLLYLPLRSLAGAPFDSSPIRTWSDFMNHVLALGFKGDMLYFRDLPILLTRAGIWIDIVRLQFGPLLLMLIPVAGTVLAIRRWRLALLLLGIGAVNVLAALTYRAPQTVEYLIPSYVAMALVLALGLDRVRIGSLWRRALVAWLLMVVSWNGLQNYASFRLLHQDASARTYAEQILTLANWHHVTPFWYLQLVEGLRRDVQVQYVYPEGSLPNEQVWLRRISAGIAERPIIVTNWFYAFEGGDYTWIPFHGAWLVRREPIEEPPEAIVASGARFGDEIELLGYALDSPVLTPGNAVSLRVYWRPLLPLTQDYSSFVQLLGPAGVLGQGDLAHTSREYLPGQVCVDSYQFPLLLQTPSGQYPLITGFYYAQGGGWQRLKIGDQDHLSLATLEVRPVDRPSVTLHRLFARLAKGPELVGVDFDRTVPGQTRVYLHWWQAHVIRKSDGAAAVLGARLQLKEGEQVVAEVSLPNLAPGSGATVVADIDSQVGHLSLAVLQGEGKPWPWIGPWCWPAQKMTLPSIPDDAHYVPLGGEMAFVGFHKPPERLTRAQQPC